ncbi:MAG: carboxypeptidase-like regulatory domain-containing protein [Bacteroidetes bacterium]|nr:carboxypeptidase-like regulatory domain-containing protein [Bacteroidota bacterium]
MKNIYTILLALFVLLTLGCKPEKSVVGQVVDPSTNKGIPNVLVSYEGFESGLTKTNSTGSFSISLNNKKKHDEVLVFLEENANADLESRYYFPSKQATKISFGENTANPVFQAYEYVEGNLTLTDKTQGGPFSYEYMEYAIFSDVILKDNKVENKRIVPFTNGSLTKVKLQRGKIYIAGKVHYSGGNVRSFNDSIIVPKSVSTSYSWTVNF